MSNIIVIEQPWGGLGDNLQYTTLPKLFSELGYDVYISSKNTYRNNEIYELVWKLNPYVKGISDLPPNAGACVYFQGRHIIHSIHSIKNIELSHGLTNGTEKYPLIYYTPKFIPELANVLLYDLTAISTAIINNDTFLEINLKSIINKYPHLTPKKVVFTKIANRNINNITTETYNIDNIFSYCDAIFSCKVFISPPSGNANLASAIRKDNITPEIYCIYDQSLGKYGPGDNHWYNNRILFPE